LKPADLDSIDATLMTGASTSRHAPPTLAQSVRHRTRTHDARAGLR
jgi:hypothetical protein